LKADDMKDGKRGSRRDTGELAHDVLSTSYKLRLEVISCLVVGSCYSLSTGEMQCDVG